MSIEHGELREMLERRSLRSDPPGTAQLVVGATAASHRPTDAWRRLGGLGRLATIGVGAVLTIGLLALAAGGTRHGFLVSPRPTIPPLATPRPASNSPRPSTSDSLEPPIERGQPIVVRDALSAAVPFGNEGRYAACVIDADGRIAVAETRPGARDEWITNTVLPIAPVQGVPVWCPIRALGESVIVSPQRLSRGAPPLRIPPPHQSWLASPDGLRTLEPGLQISPVFFPSPGSVLMQREDARASVVEIDQQGTQSTWVVPTGVEGVEGAAIDPLGHRWLVTSDSNLTATVVWTADGSGWRETLRLGHARVDGMWFDGSHALLWIWDESNPRTRVLRAAPPFASWDEVMVPDGSAPMGLLASGQIVTEQLQWLRIEHEPGRVCTSADYPACKWGTLLAGLDEQFWRRSVTVSGNDIVVTDWHGVRIIPADRASLSLVDSADAGPPPPAPPGWQQVALTFRDTTGLVTSHTSFSPRMSAPVPYGVMNRDGLGRVLWVTWTAWHCTRRPTMELSKSGDQYVVTINTGPHAPRPCLTQPDDFAVELRLSKSVDAELVRVKVENAPP